MTKFKPADINAAPICEKQKRKTKQNKDGKTQILRKSSGLKHISSEEWNDDCSNLFPQAMLNHQATTLLYITFQFNVWQKSKHGHLPADPSIIQVSVMGLEV